MRSGGAPSSVWPLAFGGSVDSIADWLASITWPLVSRVLMSLGVGTVTYTGASTALESVINSSRSAFGGLASDVASILAIGGWFDFMSITSGGLMSGLAWLVLKRFALQNTGT